MYVFVYDFVVFGYVIIVGFRHFDIILWCREFVCIDLFRDLENRASKFLSSFVVTYDVM